ncbi:MAG: TIGR03960 family B12-binding radical SAM protein [Candidatus Latescibacteria bacterium]|nr:TIGR03960 family B12-binding radical SAM protein [Candidatus Latescibacterota bacterium]
MKNQSNISDIKKRLEPFLVKVSRPARYLGGELNIIRKDPEAQKIRVCLAFPDVYDIGQSYIGFEIFYHILNKRAGTLCERTFAPWSDMETIMREENIPLWSVESFLPLSSFDVLGFTLQYELHYTTILNMLDLAGIPLKASDRGESTYPLVIGGGPCCVNPEPVADFFDAFLLGDGEEAFPAMLDIIERCKESQASKKETLRELTGIDGVYVPSFYSPTYSGDGDFTGMKAERGAPLPVNAGFVERLKPEYYPEHPLVPLCEVVHDRLAVEISRGCSRGCRFCNAGMVYRPKRERPVKELVGQIVKGIENTGWEEVSLISLSTSDYTGLEELVQKIGTSLGEKTVSISLSSMRADNFSVNMAEAVAGGRKSGLTFAVEAGTQRLRDVINKNLTEDQLFETLTTTLQGGWNSFKLYFMIGLPSETNEDVIAIADLLNRINSLLKRYKGRKINVTISPFSPKPMTPFQWEAQDSVKTITEKIQLIRRNLRAKSIQLKTDNPVVTMLECRLGRGGRELGNVIMDAWMQGSRLDGWSEFFNADIWQHSFKKAGIELESGSEALDTVSHLPWSHLSFGINESYLLTERVKAESGKCTEDCDEKCHNCGSFASFCAMMKKAVDSKTELSDKKPEQKSVNTPMYGRKRKIIQSLKPIGFLNGTRFRLKFGKNDVVRYTGHLDIVRLFDRAMRRAGVPMAYSQGFHPHPKISFGPPLPLGMKSTAEYVDFSLNKPFPDIEHVLKSHLVQGFDFIKIRSIPEKAESLNSIISMAEYYVHCDIDEKLKNTVRKILGQNRIIVERQTKNGLKTVDIRPGIIDINFDNNISGITLLIGTQAEKSVKPSEILDQIFNGHIPDGVTRTEQYTIINGNRVTPIEVIQ